MAMTTGSVGPLMVGSVAKKRAKGPAARKTRVPSVKTDLDTKTAKEYHRQRLGAPPPFPKGKAGRFGTPI